MVFTQELFLLQAFFTEKGIFWKYFEFFENFVIIIL